MHWVLLADAGEAREEGREGQEELGMGWGCAASGEDVLRVVGMCCEWWGCAASVHGQIQCDGLQLCDAVLPMTNSGILCWLSCGLGAAMLIRLTSFCQHPGVCLTGLSKKELPISGYEDQIVQDKSLRRYISSRLG